MEVYTLKEAARKAKMGVETLKRACEEGLIKASQLPNREWRIAESALEEAMHKGLDLRGITKRTGKSGYGEYLMSIYQSFKDAIRAPA